MKVRRIVYNIKASDLMAAKTFYQDALGLDLMMDHGWIATYGSADRMGVQVSVASQGGSGAPTPDLSVEVEDLDEAARRMAELGFAIEYGPINEPWGVRRCYVRDPYATLVNVLAHAGSG